MDIDNPTTECWCGVHVHSGTKIVIWIQIIFLVISASFAAVFMPLSAIMPIINICLDVLVLYGLQQRKPMFYKPYLFLTALGFCIQICTTVYALFQAFRSTSAASNYMGSIMVFFAVGAVLFYLLFIVPSRSCNLLEHELCNQRSQQIVSFQSRQNPAAAPQVVVQVPTPQSNQPVGVAPPPYPEKQEEHKEDNGMYPKLPGNIN